MNLQLLSDLGDVIDRLLESMYDLKESIIDNSTDDNLKLKFKHVATESILALSECISENNTHIDKATRSVCMKRLLELICETYDIEEEELLNNGKSRKNEHRLPRQVHMAFLHKTFGVSQKDAAAIYGLDHATCNHACGIVKRDYQTNKRYRKDNWAIIETCMAFDNLRNKDYTVEFLTSE